MSPWMRSAAPSRDLSTIPRRIRHRTDHKNLCSTTCQSTGAWVLLWTPLPLSPPAQHHSSLEMPYLDFPPALHSGIGCRMDFCSMVPIEIRLLWPAIREAMGRSQNGGRLDILANSFTSTTTTASHDGCHCAGVPSSTTCTTQAVDILLLH